MQSVKLTETAECDAAHKVQIDQYYCFWTYKKAQCYVTNMLNVPEAFVLVREYLKYFFKKTLNMLLLFV